MTQASDAVTRAVRRLVFDVGTDSLANEWGCMMREARESSWPLVKACRLRAAAEYRRQIASARQYRVFRGWRNGVNLDAPDNT